MKRGIAIILIAVVAMTIVWCVLDEPVAAAPARHHHQSIRHATMRIGGARHQLGVTLARVVCGQSQAAVIDGECDRRGSVSSHNSCELVAPLRI